MKQKTKKAAKKRFRITAKGKVLRGRQMAGHLKAAKSRTARNRYKTDTQVAKVEKRVIERLLPYEG